MKKQKLKTTEFKTSHNLPFEDAPWKYSDEFRRFRIGTCEGLWGSTPLTFDILAITNDVPGNGHFEDVLQWFSHSCRRDGKDLRIMEVWNKRLLKHLIEKRRFLSCGDHCIKKFS
jgi:hypothetical protein